LVSIPASAFADGGANGGGGSDEARIFAQVAQEAASVLLISARVKPDVL